MESFIDQAEGGALLELTAGIVAAYVGHNSLQVSALPGLIAEVNAALGRLAAPQAEPEALKPRVPIKKTVTHEYIISLEDGKRYRSMRRHLGTHGLTPDEYRAKWGLPRDYPMVAPSYAARRSEMAKAMGLGRKKAVEPAPAPKKRPTKPKT